MIDSVISTIRILAVSQLLLLVMMLLNSKNPLNIRFVAALLFTAVIAYLIMPLVFYQAPWLLQLLIWSLFRIVPALMLLFTWGVFEEGKTIPVWIKLIVSADILASIWSYGHFITPVAESALILGVLQATKIVIAGFCIYVVWRGREDDLVERRLKMRWLFVMASAGAVLSVAFVELFPTSFLPASTELLGMSVLLVIFVAINMSFYKINPNFELVGTPTHRATTPAQEFSDPFITTLLDRMRSERLYADHDLRVASLADLMGLPAYQLRKKINQDLGYRNFNQFVNAYRIEEAGVRLRENLRIPVLNIALDVGFRSMSSFNLAFHNQYGVSPTDYRSRTSTDN